MNATQYAQNAYFQQAAPIRTDRSTEYEILAKITRRIKAHAVKKEHFPELVSALHDNRKLWVHLASCVADPDNMLAQDLKARIFYLSEFVGLQTKKILNSQGSVDVLTDINVAIMRGLQPSEDTK